MTENPESHLTPAELVKDDARILRALQQGVRAALRRHQRDGHSVAVWRNGRVEWIEAADIGRILDEEANREQCGQGSEEDP